MSTTRMNSHRFSRWRRSSNPSIPIPAEIWVLVGAAFIIALGYGLVAPIIPQFARSFDVSIAAAAAVVSAFAGMRLVFAPVSGRLVNTLGSRRTYLVGLVTVAVSTMLVATAQDYAHVLVLRALGGIGSTMFTVSAMGLIVRIAPAEIRGKASSTYATAFLLGNIIGPVVGAALSPIGMRWPFVIYGVALCLATVVVAVRLRPEAVRAAESSNSQPPLKVAQAWSDTSYRAVVASAFAFGWSNFGVRVAVVPLFAAAAFHSGVAVAGIALTAFAVGNAAALQVAGRLADSIGRKPLILGGLAVNGVFTAVMGISSQPVLLLVLSVLAGAGAGLLNPAQQAVLADVIGRERSGGNVVAAYQMAQDLGAILGPVLVGLIADRAGYPWAFAVCGVVSAAALCAWLPARETLVTTPAGPTQRVQ